MLVGTRKWPGIDQRQPSAKQKATVKIVVPRRAIGTNGGDAHETS
jgi:hypothetical protein